MTSATAIADDSKLDRALALAEQGFKVFPLVENSKVPAIKGWPRKATTDPARIRRWWVDPVTGWKQDYNIGIATGHGLAVIDVDDKGNKRGSNALAALEREHGPLPATLTSRTPSGGRHLLLRVEQDVANSVEGLGDGLDVRGAGGYIVAPGSELPNGAYKWEPGHGPDSLQPAPMPAWLCAKLAAAPKPPQEAANSNTAPAVELDTPLAIDLARQYLESEAPEAIEGRGGDATTYKVACRVKDFGVSEAACLDLMLEVYNDKCSPPWEPSDLARKVASAYRYGQIAPGAKSPAADFGPVAETTEASGDAPRKELRASPLMPFQPSALTPRRWVLGRLLIRGHMTVLVAPPGMGKSTFVVNTMLAAASGRDDILAAEAHERTRVWYYNNEDDREELQRRIAAAMQHHEIAWQDVTGPDGKPMLYLDTGADRSLVIARRTGDGRSLRPQDLDDIIAEIRRESIGVFVVDPLAETHQADENDNGQMLEVTKLYRRVAHETGCAVLLIHHTRKKPGNSSDGHAGNLDSGRGASSVMGVARVAVTLEGMSDKEAKRLGVPDSERHRYVRLDQAKGNMSLGGNTSWFRRVSVPLVVGDGADIEEVGALEPAMLAPPVKGSEGDAAGIELSPQGKAVLAALAKLSGVGAAEEAGSADGLFEDGPWIEVDKLEDACIAAGVTRSVGSIRNALGRLAGMGLVERITGRNGRARLTAKGREFAARSATGDGSA